MIKPYEQLHSLMRAWYHPHAAKARLVAFQERKLRHLIRYAHANVSYYRELLEGEGISPGDIRTLDDLRRLPITDKNDLRARLPEEFLSRRANPERLLTLWTSGSSGRPFVVRRGAVEDLVGRVYSLRATRRCGMRLSDRWVKVSMAALSSETRETPFVRLKNAIGLMRGYKVSAQQPAEEIHRQLRELDPDVIVAYPSVLAQVAPLVRSPFGALRFILTGGESLTTHKRRAIEVGFGVRTFDMFGSHECPALSCECPEQRLYHVADDFAVVEVLRDGRPVAEGESGEVVVTNLHSYAMPFIRYRIGDVVVKGPETCPCGLPFSTFERVMGRVRDYLLLPDGRRVHALDGILSVITSGATWLDQYQLTQETRTEFVLRLSTFGEPVPGELASMRDTVAGNLGDGANLRVELVDDIPFEPSGKFKDCRCLLHRCQEQQS